jgi:Glycoside Hydrolase Family 113
MRWPQASSLSSLLAISILLVSCGGGSSGGGGTTPPPPAVPDFSIALNPAAVTIHQGASDTNATKLTITDINGFSGPVIIAVGAFPAGVTESFDPVDATTSSVLTLIASNSATIGGPVPVTITVSNQNTFHTVNLNVTVAADDHSGFTYNGFDHISFQPSEYDTNAGTNSRSALAATGANWAGVLATWYQANKSSTMIAANGQSPTDAAVIAAIDDLHKNGIKVMLKPHVDATSGEWRGTFMPGDVDAWFANYTTFITHYAQLAHDHNVEMFCIGTELVQLTGSANAARWANVITAIRGVYPSGLLTYAANAVGSADEFTAVSFWDNPEINLIGLDAYVPLTNQNNPTIAQLVAGWTLNASGDNAVAAYHNVSLAHSKPVIFTEIGYRSVDGANKAPFDFSAGTTFDAGEQHDCYEAMYEVWSQQSSFMKGAFWWDWAVPVPAANDTGYEVLGKPAEAVVRDWQK